MIKIYNININFDLYDIVIKSLIIMRNLSEIFIIFFNKININLKNVTWKHLFGKKFHLWYSRVNRNMKRIVFSITVES